MQMQDLIGAIQRRAYEIWLSEGRPHGRDQIHWLRAEAEVREQFAAAHSDHCKSGLHEKPVETRGGKRRSPRRDRPGGQETSCEHAVATPS